MDEDKIQAIFNILLEPPLEYKSKVDAELEKLQIATSTTRAQVDK